MNILVQVFRWLAILGVGLLVAACEESPNDVHLQIEPASVTLTNDMAVVFMVVLAEDQQVNFPLDWEVVNPALGRIAEQRGLSAVYAPTAQAGLNIVIVRDQGDGEGIARIQQ